MNNGGIKVLIEYLKQKQFITELEKDILDSWNELQKQPFDRQETEKKIIENNTRYPEVFVAISATPGTIRTPLVQLTNEDVRNNLIMQIELLCAKEIKETSIL